VVTLALLALVQDRLGASFSLAAALGLMLFLVEPATGTLFPAPHTAGMGPARVLGAGAAITIVFLYLGHLILPSPVKEVFLAEVAGKQAALKIADDAALDRSLYLLPPFILAYFHHDSVPVGTARHYERFEPGLSFNDSFKLPNRFVDGYVQP
jgi:hypothetical protein